MTDKPLTNPAPRRFPTEAALERELARIMDTNHDGHLSAMEQVVFVGIGLGNIRKSSITPPPGADASTILPPSNPDAWHKAMEAMVGKHFPKGIERLPQEQIDIMMPIVQDVINSKLPKKSRE